MHYFIGRAITGAALVAALFGADAVRAQPAGEVFDPAQVRRAALAAPESGIAAATETRTSDGKPVVRLTGASGVTVWVQGGSCGTEGCRSAWFWTKVTPPAGIDRQGLVDRYNESPRWASAHVAGEGIELRGEVMFAGGISDANLAQYMRSITHHAGRLAAGQA